MSTKLEKARAKRARRAEKTGASNYARSNSAGAAESKRAGWWQGMTIRRADTAELSEQRKRKNEGKILKLFTKTSALAALAVQPPSRPRQHRSQG